MILFPENGRLGNQLFQYCGLQAFFPNQRIIFFGFEDLKSISLPFNSVFLSRSYFLSTYLFKVICHLLILLSNLRILGQITEELYTEKYKLVVRKGLLVNIFVPVNIFFQHEDVFPRLANFPSLNPSIFDSAYSWLASNHLDPNSDKLCFVHIRRGDYLTWPSVLCPAVLGLTWYFMAIEQVRKLFPDITIVLMGDDVMYLEDLASLLPGCIVSHNRLQIDFALMTLCRYGILSASSFAWWASKYASIHYQIDFLYFAPKYWFGHRAKLWDPPFMKSSHLTYLP